jgi:uncharacterized protein YfiM (DUF2279 family)
VAFHRVAPGNNSYVPTGFLNERPLVPLATAQVGSVSIANTFNGWMGIKFKVGAEPLVVRELGRWVLSGNTQAHTVRIIAEDTGTEVASVSVATDGEPVGFKHVALASPVTLAANSTYYLVSQETSGGDQWYAEIPMAVDSSVATDIQLVLSPVVINWSEPAGKTDKGYGPVNMKYTLEPTPFVIGHSMSTLRNDFTGWLGTEITVGASPLSVTHLGRWVVPGNSGTHTVKLVDAATGTDVASASVATAGAATGQFQYTSLSTPVALAENTSYYLLSQEIAGGDLWYDFSNAAAGTATGYQDWLLANGLPMDASGEGSATATPASDGLSNLVKYALGLNPNESGNGARLNSGTLNVSGADYFTFSYTRPAPAPTDITYAVEASGDLMSWSGEGIVQVSSTVNAGLETLTFRDSVPTTGAAKRLLRLKISQQP